MSDNHFSGRIPNELGSATALTGLYLFSNELTGSIPSTLGNLVNLGGLLLSSNQLSGDIPAALTGLTKLTSLSVSSNLLSGSLPGQIGQLTNLTSLSAYANQLRGEVPRSILSLTKTTKIYLGNNALRASDPQVLAFLEARNPFASLQTVPPANAHTTSVAVVVDVDADPVAASQTACRGSSSRGVLQYFPATGGMVEREIELGLLQTFIGTDVVRTLFGIESDTIGHLLFVPSSGEFAATSRTYTTAVGNPGTFGTAVPAQGLSISLKPGQSRRIGALPDSTRKTIGQRSPGTSRTNFGIVETAGEPATVRVSVFLNDPRSLAAGNPTASRIYELAPNQLINISNLVESVVGANRETLYGDLTGMAVQFDVTSASGSVVIYTSSIDNGSGDSILRTE